MANWTGELDLSGITPLYKKGELTLNQVAKGIAGKLEELSTRSIVEGFDYFIHLFKIFEGDDADAFDCLLEELYDWADENRVWIIT